MSSIRKLARQARSQRRRWSMLVITLGMMIIIGLLMARPVLERWRAMQSRLHLAKAHAALEQQDYMTALKAVQQAALATPQDCEVLRTAVQVLAGLEAPPDEILTTLRQLEAMGGMAPDMHLMRARAELLRGDLLAAEQALNTMPEAARQCWEAVELEATLLLRQGRAAEAGERLHSSTESTPGASFRRAVLELALHPGAGSFPARQVIWQTARGEGKDKLLALTLLSQDAILTASEAEELLRLTEQATAPGLRHAVLAQVFRLALERMQPLIQAESQRAADQPVEQQVSFLLFLAKQQAPQEILAFLRAHGSALTQQRPADHVNLELEALAKAQDWQAVRAKLQTPDASRLNRTTQSLWTACATQALNPGHASVLPDLQLAFESTGRGKDRAASTRVADTAMNLGHAAFAATCYEQIAALPMPPSDRSLLLEKACHALAECRDTPALWRIAHTLADAIPGHLGHACRAIYLDLICQEPLEIIIPQLNALETSPTSEPLIAARQKLLWAMIYLRRNQSRELHRELDGLEKQLPWSPGERAVLAGLLAKAGEPARAWALVEKLPAGLLLPEEAELAKAAR